MQWMIRFFISTFCSFLVFSFFCFSGFALPIDFDWTNRPVAVRLNSAELQGVKPPSFTSAGQPITLTRSAEKISIRTYLDKSMLGYDYALRIRIQGEIPLLLVNDKLIEAEPVIGSDGSYFCIQKQYLLPGENTIELTTEKGFAPQVESLEMFALLFSNEEVHFDRVFGAKTAIVMAQPATHPEQTKYDVLHYELNHIVTMTSSIITANLTMIAKCTTVTLRTAVFDLDDNSGSFSVQSVDQGPGTSTLTYTHNSSQNRLYVSLPNAPLPLNSIFTVRVFYRGTPNPNGTFGAPYRRTTHSGTAIVYSFSEPYGARQWWPCKDVPDDKATLETRWTCPTAYIPVSNGKLVSVTTSAGNHTFNYYESYPITTYLVSVACTNYLYEYGIYTSQNLLSRMTVGAYIFPENAGTESGGYRGTITMIDFFAKKFGEYPFLTEKYVTAEHTITSSMEHQTATSLRANGLESGGFTRSNIHELAHQWFGDMITMQHFDHLWLNEGFATYCEALWQEGFYGKDSYHSWINAWTTSDTYPIVSSSADSFSGSIVYRKGAWVLHMLRHIVGDSTFFAALRNYAENTALRYGTALSIDFQRDVERTMGGSTSLSWFFDEWLYQAPRPNYTWNCWTTKSGSTTVLNLEITQTQATSTYIMPIDFRVYFSPSGNTTITVWNTQKAKQTYAIPIGIGYTISSVAFDPDNWVLEYKNVSSMVPVELPVELSQFEAIISPREFHDQFFQDN
ncbi:MAG: M1 family metallopeptidase [bacterium]|nr:M1 family metallopeptidase [bacterium]